MKISLIRRFVALAAVSTLAAQAHAATLAFEALYDPANGNISIRPFDSDTGNPWVGTAEFAVFDFNSTSGVFTGDPPNFNPAPVFPPANDTDTRISTALLAGPYMTATYAAPYDLGNVAQTGLTQGFIDTDFTSGSSGTGTLGAFTYNYAGGGANKIGTVRAVPESSTPVISSQSEGGSFPGGSTIVLSVVATGVPSPDYQWQRDGVDLIDSSRLSGSRTSKLNVTNARRTDSGTYRVRVHNSAGFANSTGTPVKVKVSQRMDAPVMLGNGNVLLRFSDSDGGALDATHINLFTLQWSSNLTDWTDYPAVFTAASGKLERSGIGEDGNPQRFYRVLER